MNVYRQIVQLLKDNKIEYKTFEHNPVLTSEEAASIRGNELGMGAKAMIMRSSGKFIMAIISGEKKIDMKKLKQIIGSKSLSFATHDEVMQVSDCEVGGVPPFGNLFKIPVYMDKHITKFEKIDFNAGLRTHSIEIKLKDYISIVKPEVVEFAKD